MPNAIAIDFGTSRTKLAYWHPERRQPQLMQLGHNEPSIPSLFYLEQHSERILLGDDAEAMLTDDPHGVIDILKRRLRDTYIYKNHRRIQPLELLTRLLRYLRERAGKEIACFKQAPPEAVFLTIPALYGSQDEKIWRAAALHAGFPAEAVRLVPEPVAAACAWLAETGSHAKDVVVLDCGGGTLDWTYLRRQDNAFSVPDSCPPGGDIRVGGYDVDRELLNLMKVHLTDTARAHLEARQLYYLQQVRDLKERYCRDLPWRPIQIESQQVMLAQDEMQAAINRRFIEQTVEGLGTYLKKVQEVAPDADLTVLLVGGSARLKGLGEALESRLGRQTTRWEWSEYATVLGALPVPQLDAPAPAVRILAAPRSFVLAVTFSPDGQVLASGSDDGTLRLWDVGSGQQRHTLTHQGGARTVAFSPDGTMLASGGYDATIKLWTVSTGQLWRMLVGHKDSVLSVTFSPDGQMLASGSRDRTLILWDTASGQPRRTLVHWTQQQRFDPFYSVASVTFSPDGQTLAAASANNTIVWHVASAQQLHTLREHSGRVFAVAFSPDGQMLASGSKDGTIRLWEKHSGRALYTFERREAASAGVRSIAFSPDGRRLVSGSEDQTVTLWDVAGRRAVRTLTEYQGVVFSVAFSPDGRTLAAGSGESSGGGREGRIMLWQ